MPSTTFRLLLACAFGAAGCTARPADDSAPPRAGEPVPALVVDRSAAVTPDSAPRATPGHGAPMPGAWEPTTRVTDSLYTIEIPGTAHAAPGRPNVSGGRAIAITELPGCHWFCVVQVDVWRGDAGKGLADEVHDEVTADTTHGDPDADIYVATIADSLPLGAAPAVHLETYCGDCTSHAILTQSGAWMARIEVSLDDREPYDPALVERLLGVARSFRWRRPAPP